MLAASAEQKGVGREGGRVGASSHQALLAALLMSRCLVRLFSPLPATLGTMQGGDGWLEAHSEECGGEDSHAPFLLWG